MVLYNCIIKYVLSWTAIYTNFKLYSVIQSK